MIRTFSLTLTNSLHIVVPHGAHGLHGLQGMSCVDHIMAEFIERGTTKDIDVVV